MYNPFGRSSITLIAVLSFTLLNAETFADFKRSQFDSFKSYKDEKDKLFDTYLKSSWEAYKEQKTFSLYDEPKPLNITPARHREIKKLGPKVSINIKPDKKEEASQKTEMPENTIVVQIALEPESKQNDIEFDFFGTVLGFNIPNGLQQARFYPQNQKGISNFFDVVSATDYDVLTQKIITISNEMNLNDWGKYLLVKELSEKIFMNLDDSKLLSWFIFNKLGYSVRIGLADKHVVLMYHSKKIIYATPNYKIDGKVFYAVSDYAKRSSGSVFTYKQNYPGSDKAFDLVMESLPNFKEDLKTKPLSFAIDSKEYTISYSYNQNLIDFMSTYPQADYETFFNAPMDGKTYQDIAKGLRKHINSKQASVAINFVLNFVQNAFKYEVDQKQFSREKVMFAQETLYYDKSDCEDRAVLFSYLVKELFDISVIGVKYKDHMATALYIPMQGDSVKMNSKRFVIADPTYINAAVGQSMPKYKPKRPESFIVVGELKGRKL